MLRRRNVPRVAAWWPGAATGPWCFRQASCRAGAPLPARGERSRTMSGAITGAATHSFDRIPRPLAGGPSVPRHEAERTGPGHKFPGSDVMALQHAVNTNCDVRHRCALTIALR